MKTSSGTNNVISLDDYRKSKQVKTEDSVKQVFKDSLDNQAVMQRYRINQPSADERKKAIQESLNRINKLMEELGNKCST
jgi:hypothetical protein